MRGIVKVVEKATGFFNNLLVKELKLGVIDGRVWYYQESEAYNIDTPAADRILCLP